MGSPNAEKPLSVLEDALKGGITCFQLREKGKRALVGMEKRAFAVSCQRLCAQYGVPFIVNDDVDLAVEIDADGVHVGQDDMEARFVRKRIGSEKIVGVSVHTVDEANKAIADGADYVGMGPVYPTITKADAKPVAGTAMIEEVAAVYPDLPIVGIGGITAENAEPVFRAGASGISVISAIASSTDPELAARRLAEVSLKWSRDRGVLR
ncbi:thiamine phosphate synthase [Sporosarcina luteola]|uniref:thiamine phosphate synthase n=1 Tax=Sporosarcina luteola TaxID=582850 RepID=UPI00203BF913|nr:thiamine phosphate synthase [Sporosarcina luteola]MCM3711877.1 thiamine phosphate synthase [Sporosarcina luteola]